MTNTAIVNENRLDDWVRRNERDAQGVIVELVYRLVAASVPRPLDRRFPLSDSIGQTGPDGFLDTERDFKPFVPQGKSFWEIGTGADAAKKARDAYRGRTNATPAEVRIESTFVFVTPLSGLRGWPHTWKKGAQARWQDTRRKRQQWRDVRLIDGCRLVDWLHQFPPVELWLAAVMGIPVHQMETTDQHWSILKRIGAPPPLSTDVFLIGRDAACAKLREVFSGTTPQLKLETRFRDQVADFVSAYIEKMDKEERVDITSRSLIISGPEGWNAVTNLRDRHFLIADFDLDGADAATTRMVEKARGAGHSVIYGGLPGGIPHPNRVAIPNPRSDQMKEALVKAGYMEERARVISLKSDGNLHFLLRCLHNLSLMPEWSQDTDAAELAIAELLGAWRENSEGDKAIAEKLSKKAYGEWIGKIREVALRPNAPLTHRDDSWKVVDRYEGWYALGLRLYDEHLELLKEAAVHVLRERDPQFELPPEERYLASIKKKVLSHSHSLRNGLAETLALLGSHAKALTSCSFGKAETTAVLAVRETLADADWVLWASLNDVLPLLAEAAPGEFLTAVEIALHNDLCPFDTVFAQEGSGLMSRTYMTGLLWALEMLAWDSEYLTRVVLVLGELAARDPGGTWSNRPKNSLSMILLPWLPQTAAPVEKRRSAVMALSQELPDIAWELLLALLPNSLQTSMGTRRPTWREMIPDNWSQSVTGQEYWDQTGAYAEMAIDLAKQDIPRLAMLIGRLNDLLPVARVKLLNHLRSQVVVSLPEGERLRLSDELVSLVSTHRKFAQAKWAMKPDVVNEIASVADLLAPAAPFYRHQRLFGERELDLFEEAGNYEEQRRKLEERREKAVDELFAVAGLDGVLEFAKAVQTPWGVGAAFGSTAKNDVDFQVLPALLESETASLAQFAAGFVQGRFRKGNWLWVDEVDKSQWSSSQKGQLLAYLPFARATWDRASRLLGPDEAFYWSKANANPFEEKEDLEFAVDRLVDCGRPLAAIGCLAGLLHHKKSIDNDKAIRALQALLRTTESPNALGGHAILEVIKALQDSPGERSDDICRLEWAFLPLLDRQQGAAPRLLEQWLAESPPFFCEVIRAVFRSEKAPRAETEATKEKTGIATNAYQLFMDWRTPPGTLRDGSFDGKALQAWLKQVKEECAVSGHTDVALTMFGHVLIYAPPDPDGLWLHRSAAEALNAKDAEDIRQGFQTALINSRGVYPWTAGKAELEIAAKYRKQAEELESHGYHRVADTLRSLAAFYVREAEQAATRHPHDD